MKTEGFRYTVEPIRSHGLDGFQVVLYRGDAAVSCSRFNSEGLCAAWAERIARLMAPTLPVHENTVSNR